MCVSDTKPKIHEAKPDSLEGGNRQFSNNSWSLQYCFFLIMNHLTKQ